MIISLAEEDFDVCGLCFLYMSVHQRMVHPAVTSLNHDRKTSFPIISSLPVFAFVLWKKNPYSNRGAVSMTTWTLWGGSGLCIVWYASFVWSHSSLTCLSHFVSHSLTLKNIRTYIWPCVASLYCHHGVTFQINSMLNYNLNRVYYVRIRASNNCLNLNSYITNNTWIFLEPDQNHIHCLMLL